MKRLITPILYAIIPVLFLFTYNIGEITASASNVVLPFLATILATVVLYFLTRLVIKNPNKLTILVSFTMFWFFTYGYIITWWTSQEATIFYWRPVLVTLLLWGAILAVVVIGVLRAHRTFDNLTRYLGLVAIILVAISTVNVGIFFIRSATVDYTPTDTRDYSNFTVNQENTPDIYYIIPDWYARGDTLRDIYGFDNSEFLNYLSEKGFYVASESRCNYQLTTFSLASSLNMEHLDYLAEIYGESSQDFSVYSEMTYDNKASHYLKLAGYNYIWVDRIPIAGNPHVEIAANRSKFGLSYFASALLQKTPLNSIIHHYTSYDRRSKILWNFEATARVATYYDTPVFAVTHIKCPHKPYLFDRYGNTPKDEDRGTAAEQYVEQVRFVNMKLKILIDEILRSSEVPPIIVLQADHARDLGGSKLAAHQFSILNAYYFPDQNYELLYPSITPVNTFRVIFNQYLGADYELLEDKSYDMDYHHPYQFPLMVFED